MSQAPEVIAAGDHEIMAKLREVGSNFGALRANDCFSFRQCEQIGDQLQVGPCEPLRPDRKPACDAGLDVARAGVKGGPTIFSEASGEHFAIAGITAADREFGRFGADLGNQSKRFDRLLFRIGDQQHRAAITLGQG